MAMQLQEAEQLAAIIEADCGGAESGARVSLIEQGDGTYTVWLRFAGQDEFGGPVEYAQWRDGAYASAYGEGV